VYCARQVVKTLVIISNNPVYLQLPSLSAGHLLLQANEQSPDNCDKERPALPTGNTISLQ